jgi:hypothetical protein
MTSMQPTHPTEPSRFAISTATFRAALVAALVWMIPFGNWFSVFLERNAEPIPDRLLPNAYIAPPDVILAILIVVVSATLLRRSYRSGYGLGGAGLLIAAGIIFAGVLISPSLAGWVLLLRVFGAGAVILAIRSMNARTLMLSVVWSFALSSSLQSVLAIVQTFVLDSGRVGRADIESVEHLWTAGIGTFNHEYALAAYLSLSVGIALSSGAVRRLDGLMWVSIALSSAAIATSFGRSAALSVIAVSAVYGVGWVSSRNREYLLGTVIPTASLAVAGALAASAWLGRANLDSSIRITLARQALDVAVEHPILGVGPMHYGLYLAQLPLREADQIIVHNVPLLVAAEFGVIMGLVFLVWLVALGVRAFSTSVRSAGLFVVVVPFLVFDHMHYLLPAGLGLIGFWLGMLDVHSDWNHDIPELSSDPSRDVNSPTTRRNRP